MMTKRESAVYRAGPWAALLVVLYAEAYTALTHHIAACLVLAAVTGVLLWFFPDEAIPPWGHD